MRRHIALFLAISFACRSPVAPVSPTPGKPTVKADPPIASNTSSGRPQVEIERDAKAGMLTVKTAEQHVVSKDAVTSNLSDAETAALHARMEPLPDLSKAAVPTVRPPSPAPARAGAVQPIAFVVPTGKAVSDAPMSVGKVVAPLPVPQITPQGEIRSESEIKIRFSDAMVPVAQVDAQAKAPATITPPIEGSWRWIDSRVIAFKSKAPRFPQATEFTVTVQPGIESLTGGRLMAETSVKFSTAPVSIKGGFPSRVIRPDSPVVVYLDQDIDPTALTKLLKVTSGKRNTPVPFTTTTIEASRALWAKNPSLDLVQPKAEPRRHVVLAPQGSWPAGQELQISLGKNAPSLEGPLKTTRESFVSFEVAAPFRAIGIQCDDADKVRWNPVCPAKGYMAVEFSNAIREETFRAQKLQIAGREFEDRKPSGSSVSLRAPEIVGRTWRIDLGEGIEDIYGQPNIGARALGFTTKEEKFYPLLEGPTGLHVLDPRFEIPQWVLRAEAVSSVRVQLFSVTAKDYPAYLAAEEDPKLPMPGKRISDKSYAIGARWGADLRVDLRPALDKAGVGHIVALATQIPAPGQTSPGRLLAWMQVTKLGVVARIDEEKIQAWAMDISPHEKFMAPREGVTTTLSVDGSEISKATTDATGHVALDLATPPAQPRRRQPLSLVTVQSGTDTAFTAIDHADKTIRADNALWYVTDDRFTYKPGETVYLKGWVRWTHNGTNPDLAMPRPGEAVSWLLSDSRGTKLGGGTMQLTDQGGFHTEVAIPANANLGQASFSLTTRNQSYRHPIAVQEFRTPAYAVTLNDDVSHSGAIPVILGESIEMQTTARYYAGGNLPGADIKWAAKLRTTEYRPAGWAMYSFDPPDKRSMRNYYGYRRYRRELETSADLEGSLSSMSTASVTYGIAALPASRTSILEVDATVTDVDRMSIRASSRPILVHPSTYYVGLRLKPGTQEVIEAVVTDIDGNPVAGVPIKLAFEGVLGSERWRDDATVIDTQDCTVTSAATPVVCGFHRKDDKTAYLATATIADARGRTNRTQFEVPWWSYDEKKTLTLTPDKAKYRPGDVAKLELMSTVLPSTAVVTFARQGIISQKRLALTQKTTTIELPIELSYLQNIHVEVDRYGDRVNKQPGSTLPLPEVTSVEANLAVDVESARLDMRTRSTQKLVQPGEDATFEVDIAHDGKPVAGAEVALVVVDEAILALSNRSHADPLAPFYREVAAGTWRAENLDLVHDSGNDLAGPPGFKRFVLDETTATGSGSGMGYGAAGYGSGGGGMGFGTGVVTARKDFRATAVFAPVLKTDQRGHVSITVKMPDSLTRFRIVALATSEGHFFGKAESNIVTQRKVNARTVAPRFLSQGDSFALPIVVQNLDTKPRTVDVAVRAANLMSRGPAGKRVVIPAGNRAEVRFDFATAARGKAAIQTIIVSGPFADASTLELPVYEPATTESFATYGTVDNEPQREQLAVPANVFADVGGVEVEVASTQLQSLTDAYWYLYAYPYECAEQRSGRMLATSAMYDILDAFNTPGKPTRAEIDEQRKVDAAILAKTQKPDGGWGYFGGMKSDDLVTMQVLQALDAQKITSPVTIKAQRFVGAQWGKWIDRLTKAAALPAAQRKDRLEYPYLVGLAAMAVTTLASDGFGKARAQQLHAVATALDAYPIDAKARVLAVLAKTEAAKPIRTKLLGDLLNATRETASAATVAVDYVEGERLLLVSKTKTNALVLDALIREAPETPVITKLARGVLDGRRYGRWMSTQENLVALQAMRRYFDVFEKTTPNYTGKIWLGTASYAEQAFSGHTGTRGIAGATWTTLVPGSSHDIAFAKDGPGRMYYRVGITYAPKDTNLPALDAGFIVRRTYTAVDDPNDVIKNADGSYKIKLGARVLVRLEAINPTQRFNVALVDPLPAGFEAVNTNLAIAERAVVTDDDDRWDHTNMRDNRSEAFRFALPAGAHRFSFTARATTPGRFVAAPTKAEEMYAPETFGRSAGTTVTVE